MKPFIFILLLSSGLGNPIFSQIPPQPGLELLFQPDSIVYVFENKGPEMSKTLYTAVIQNIAIVNNSENKIHLEKVIVKAVKNGDTLQLKNIHPIRIKNSAAKFKMLQDHGYLDLYDFQFQTSQYIKGYGLAANDTLGLKEAIILAHETFLFEELPHKLTVHVEGLVNNDKRVITSRTIAVVNHKSLNSYVLPLKGSWTVAAGPSLIGHHRWGSIQEFAFDFIKIGIGQSSFQNDGTQLEDFHAYGEAVYAIEDGVVVSVLDGMKESSENLKKIGESEEEYAERIRPYQNTLISKGFQYIFGNHLVIRHANNEYSNYFHLKMGSVVVREGEKVEKGQFIGQIGNSGNSTEPHLHFHLSDGPDIIHARSIPIEFDNLLLFPIDNGSVRHLHSGQILRTTDKYN
nr:M23 family metallopeptidase [uncultured Allomuricauda sp.]